MINLKIGKNYTVLLHLKLLSAEAVRLRVSFEITVLNILFKWNERTLCFENNACLILSLAVSISITYLLLICLQKTLLLLTLKDSLKIYYSLFLKRIFLF